MLPEVQTQMQSNFHMGTFSFQARLVPEHKQAQRGAQQVRVWPNLSFAHRQILQIDWAWS